MEYPELGDVSSAKWSSSRFCRVAQRIAPSGGRGKNYHDYAKVKKRYGEDLAGLDEEAADWLIKEELAAQYFAGVATNHMDRFVARLAQGGRELLAKVREALKAFADELKNALKRLAGIDPATAAALRTEAAQAERIFDLFEEAARQAEEVREQRLAQQGGTLKEQAEEGQIGERSAESGETKTNSIKVTRNMDYAEQLRQIEDRKLNGSNSLYIGSAPVLTAAGFSEAPFAMNQADYRKARRKEGKNKNYSSHAVPLKYFKILPQKLNESVIFINNGIKVTVVTDYKMLDNNGQPSFVVAGVWQNQKMDNDVVNQIKSTYPLDDFTNRILQAGKDGKLIVTDKSKAEELLASIGVQPAEQSSILGLAKSSIAQEDTKSQEGNSGTRNSYKIANDSENGQDQMIVQEAKRHFVTTNDYRTAGYMLRDGELLDFSGAHWLAGNDEQYIADWRSKNDIRQVDHEDIFEAFEAVEEDFPSDSSLAFMQMGNIRMVPESPGVELSAQTEPTAEQYRRLKDYIKTVGEDGAHYYNDRFSVDLTTDRKHKAGTLHYTGNINADRIINDIKHFYATGEVREQNIVERFMFSRKVDYDKPITREDIGNLRTTITERKSVTSFTEEELEATTKWAYKYWKDIGIKSPFFRAWCDWRAFDTTKVSFVSVSDSKITPQDVSRESAHNKDTDWIISITRDGIDETAKDSGKWSSAYHSLKDIQAMLADAVLLDSQPVVNPSKRMGNNAAFVHFFYCPITINAQKGIAKLYVAESYDDSKKFYLTKIESEYLDSMGLKTTPLNSSKYSDNISISEIYKLVKENDVEFHPGRQVSPEVLNENGTPKVLYHQTNADFTIFDTHHEGAGRRDNETPFGIFMKSQPSDIGIKGNKQMPLYANLRNPLSVKNRADLVRQLQSISPEFSEAYQKGKRIDAEYKKRMEDADTAWKTYLQTHPLKEGQTRASRYEDPEFMRLFDAEHVILDEWTKTQEEQDKKTKDIIVFTLKTNGYDGVILAEDTGSWGRKTDAYIALDANQVKSAETGTEMENKGTFSRYDNDIRYSRKAEDARGRFDAAAVGGEMLGQMLDTTLDVLHKAHAELDKAQYDAWLQGETTEGRVKTRKGVLSVVKKYNDEKLTGVSNEEFTDRIMNAFMDLKDYDYGAEELVNAVLDVMADKAAAQVQTVENETRDIIRGITDGAKYVVSDAEFRELTETLGGRRAMNDVFRTVYGFTLVPEREAQRRGASVSFDAGMQEVTEALPGLFANSSAALFGYDADNGNVINMATALFEMQDAMQVQERTMAEELGLDKLDPDSDEALEATMTLYERAYLDAIDMAEDLIRLTPVRTLADTYVGRLDELRQAAKGQLQARRKEIAALMDQIKTAEVGVNLAAQVNRTLTDEAAKMERQIGALENELADARYALRQAEETGRGQATALAEKVNGLEEQIAGLKDDLKKERAKVTRRDVALIDAFRTLYGFTLVLLM